MSSHQTLQDFGKVSTIHVLKTGEIIESFEEYQKVEERFSWVDRKDIIRQILRLRKQTDFSKKSVIVMYEDGRMIREFVNVEEGFKPLCYY
jgi:hypothetical protein